MSKDTIYRQDAINALAEDMPQPYTPDGSHPADDGIFMAQEIYADCIQTLKELPSVQPEITDEQAIGHLQASGWMQSHDKQMYEMGLKERLADDSDSYDALLPSSQPETNCSEIPNTSDLVSRKAVREMVATWSYDMAEWEDMELALSDVDKLPSAHPEVIHCKDCKHYRTIGAFGVPLHKEEYYCDEEQRELPEWWFCAGAERKENGYTLDCQTCDFENPSGFKMRDRFTTVPKDVYENMQMVDLREEQEERLGVAPILNPKR